MSIKNIYPILEFDNEKTAFIEPSEVIKNINAPKSCVITYFKDVIAKKLEEGKLEQISTIRSATIDIPVYKTDVNGEPVCLVLGYLGSAGAAGQLEILIASGCSKFIVCGSAGVLQKDIAVGHLIVPYSAVRDEGASYHYIEPSREIECSPQTVKVIEQVLENYHIPYIKAKTWTTDAFYRETKGKIALRLSEGCVTVEMEAAAFFAVSKFRGVKLGQILYGGDDLSGNEWDDRNWNQVIDVRTNMVELAMEISLKL